MNIESQEVFDTGKTLITMSVERGRKGPIITAFVDGCSLRCGVLHIERMRDLFMSGVSAICDDASDETLDEIESYILNVLSRK